MKLQIKKKNIWKLFKYQNPSSSVKYLFKAGKNKNDEIRYDYQ